MIKLGLTGGIGSGKSTVSNFLREIGIKVIDADIISREVLISHPEILVDIRSEFGDQVFNEDGSLNRKELGEIIFSSLENKKKLEEIMIPRIREEIEKQFVELKLSGEDVVVLDAPTLMENNMHVDMDATILIWVDVESQISRVINRDGLERQHIINRIQAQMSLDEKKKYADFIVDNRFSVDNTLKQIKKILSKIRDMEKLKSEKV